MTREVKYPADSVQAAAGGEWWVPATAGAVTRGRLLNAFIPFVGLTPYTLRALARAESTSHRSALFELAPMRAAQPASAPRIPVAALPSYPGEVHAVYRAKRRPAVVLSVGGTDLPREIRALAKGWQTHSMLLVAPFFGVEASGQRGGWHPEFVRRIRHATYPQYLYDRLPGDGSTVESILRLDQIQPIGRHQDSYEKTPWTLSDEALAIIDEWLVWLVTGVLDGQAVLAMLRSELPKLVPDPSQGTQGGGPAGLSGA